MTAKTQQRIEARKAAIKRNVHDVPAGHDEHSLVPITCVNLPAEQFLHANSGEEPPS